MKIEVTQEDIETGLDAIGVSIRRQTGIDVIVDKKYMVVKGNNRFPRRLPLSVEMFQINMALGQVVKPFSFEI